MSFEIADVLALPHLSYCHSTSGQRVSKFDKKLLAARGRIRVMVDILTPETHLPAIRRAVSETGSNAAPVSRTMAMPDG